MKNSINLFTVTGALILVVTLILSRFLSEFPDMITIPLYVISCVFLLIGLVKHGRS